MATRTCDHGDLYALHNVKIEHFKNFDRYTYCSEKKWRLLPLPRSLPCPIDLDLFPDYEPAVSRLDPVQRARRRIFDIINLNSWDWFVTFTLDGSLVDRYDAKAFAGKLRVYLSNLVQRQGIAYLLVPEEHRDGALHAHALVSGDLQVVDSGTVTWRGQKRPVRRQLAQKYGIPDDMLKTVYNVPSWRIGYSTAIRTYGDGYALAEYVGKYITKDSKRIFGKWYWHGGKLIDKPDITLDDDIDFHCIDSPEYLSPVGFERYKIVIKTKEGVANELE